MRIWWDKHAKHPSPTRASFWRPVPPPGYVSLGDCLVAGMYCPPRGVTVIREAEPQGLAGTGAPPLLARPRGFVLVSTCLPACLAMPVLAVLQLRAAGDEGACCILVAASCF